jgi:hypothetical protein
MRFAAQSNPEESSLDSLSGEQYQVLARAANVTRWTPGTPLRDELERGRRGTELWFPLAMMALILGTAETVLAHWFSRPK